MLFIFHLFIYSFTDSFLFTHLKKKVTKDLYTSILVRSYRGVGGGRGKEEEEEEEEAIKQMTHHAADILCRI